MKLPGGTEGVRLGAGLTRLGRPWGVRPAPVPSDDEARIFLETAFASGIRVFDTAPSYGASEERLGRFLGRLPAEDRLDVFVATKFGEQWDSATDATVVDHSYDALARSLENSLGRLTRIDLIQLHRPNAEAIRSVGVRRAFGLARSSGVPAIGASVSSIADARLALEVLDVAWIQFPFHVGNTYMEDVFALARDHRILINRPFGMGALVAPHDAEARAAAFRHILARPFHGAILTGTASPEHLRENVEAFLRATGVAAGAGRTGAS